MEFEIYDPFRLGDGVFSADEQAAWSAMLVEEMDAADQPRWLAVASKNELEELGHDSEIPF